MNLNMTYFYAGLGAWITLVLMAVAFIQGAARR
ncbi:hypothetical protein BGLT_02215 [Caballeronia glathei]|nr:hypothetical protein BGLT_02215 [Caballeronia glathei]